MNLSYIATPVVGSIIGYTTNWLAIKMLFKPYKAKYIGNFKIPFTPGVIPREKERIARSLGDAVGNSLLTEEIILKELTNDEVKKQLKQYVKEQMLSKPFSVDGILHTLYQGKEEQIASLYRQLTVQIVPGIQKNVLENSEFEFMIQSILKEKISPDKEIKEILTDQGIEKIDTIIMNNDQSIANGLLYYLEREDIADRLKGVIDELLAEKLGGLAAMFVQGDKLYGMIVNYIENQLEKPAIRGEMATALVEFSHNIYNKQIQDFIDQENYSQMVDSLSVVLKQKIADFFEDDKFTQLLENLIINLSQQEILMDEQMKNAIDEAVEQIYVKFAKEHLPVFIKQFDVSSIIKNQIREFNVQQLETLILKIVDKELNAITWFGALLGFAMGLITLLF